MCVRDDRLHRGENIVVAVVDVLGEGPHGRVAQGCGSEITPPVTALRGPPLVIGLAVALDDQPSIDDKVHPPDAGDLHLDLDVAAEPPEQQAHECLGAGFAAPIQQLPQAPEPTGKAREDVGEVGFVDESVVPRVVERRNRVAR